MIATELRRIAAQIADLLDADQDVKALKLASALAGRLPRYRADVDALLAQLAAEDSADLCLRKLEVLLGGTNVEERAQALIADQKVAWLAHGTLREAVDKLQARLDAAEQRV